MNKCLSENFCSPSLHQTGNAAHGTYFPHIDGLRAFAVLAVVLYHLQEWTCPGGYTGVDIFFVISAYLIGGGLARSLKEGTFSLSSFCCRRIRRIMPAHFCLIAVVPAFGCMVPGCDDLRTLGRTVRPSALFITNTYLTRTAGDYFGPSAEVPPAEPVVTECGGTILPGHSTHLVAALEIPEKRRQARPLRDSNALPVPRLPSHGASGT